MPRIYRLSKSGIKLLYKIRHHKGHGVHSPFVFDFINKVIEEKTPYYAYDDIRTYMKKFPYISFNETKTHRLIFKTVNHFGAKNILELGAGNGINSLYLTIASSNSHCLSVELDSSKYKKAGNLYREWNREITLHQDKFPQTTVKPDCIYVDLKSYHADWSQLASYLLSQAKEDSYILIDGIRTKRKHQLLWRRLIKNDEVIVSLDLFNIGVLFFNKKYHKRNYKLSF